MDSANPHYRLITAPDTAAEYEKIQLPAVVNVARWVLVALTLGLLLFCLSGGTMESRVTYVLAYALTFTNPVWGMYAVAVMMPLFLLDQSKTHMLACLDIFVMGTIAAELRLLDRPRASFPRLDGSLLTLPRVYWGAWPHFLLGLGFVLIASSLVGFHHLIIKESMPAEWLPRVVLHMRMAIYGAATEVEWAGRSLWNWLTGMFIALIAARRLDLLSMARYLKLGGISVLAACFFGLLDWMGILSLTHVRAINPDPLQIGRLQGLAGHPGWLAEAIVLMWPGLLLWWSAGRHKRNAVLAGSLALVGLCLVLTAARAAWLGAMVSAGVGALFLIRNVKGVRRAIPYVIGVVLLVAVAGFLLGGEVLHQRLATILRVTDRTNYYISTWFMLGEHPLGLGLGTHFRHYDMYLTHFLPFWQKDHVTSHSLWLHTLVENGPAVPLMLLAGLAGVFLEVRRSLPLFDLESRVVVVAMGLGVLGLIVVSVAQYVPYIRVIELSIWIALGALVGHARRVRCVVPPGEVVESARGRRLLLVCGVVALIMATHHVRRDVELLRATEYGPDGEIVMWTPANWRTAITPDIDRINLALYRKALPATVHIGWPDGTRQTIQLQPEEYRALEYHPASTPSGIGWLTITTTPTWTPSEHLEGSTDMRALGVYLAPLTMDSPRIRQLRAEAEARKAEESP